MFHEVDVYTMSSTACTANTGWGPDEITNNMICASRPGKGICSGDSGGPLMIKERNSFSLIGVSSFVARGCLTDPVPHVYARVTQQLPWIEQRIQGTCPYRN